MWKIVQGVASVSAVLAAMLVLAGGASAAAPYPTTYVAGTGGIYTTAPSDGSDCSVESSPCESLAGALAQTAQGGTVYLSGTLPAADAAASVAQAVTIAVTPGASTATIQGASVDTTGLLAINTSEAVNLTGLTFTGGISTTAGAGGAISNDDGATLTVTDSTFTNNTAGAEGDGGAIDNADNDGTGTLNVTDSTFTNNTAGYDGGAIDNGDSGNGMLNVTDSTFTNNTAYDGGAIDNADDGGTGTLNVTDSTFTNNTGDDDGGAIDNADSGNGMLNVTGSTFTNNNAGHGGGAAIGNVDNSGGSVSSVVVTSSTLAGGSAADGGLIDTYSGQVDLAADVLSGVCTQGGGTWDDAGYNAATDASCLASPAASTDAPVSAAAGSLGSLAANGGPTQTLELLAGNPAINLIPDNTSLTVAGVTVSCPVTADQRGTANPGSSGCDAGAIQYAAQTIAFSSTAPTGVSAGGPTYTPAATSSSGLPVDFSVDGATTNSACSISGGVVSFNHAGSCVIDATGTDPTNFAPAQVQQTITVTAAASPPPAASPHVRLLSASEQVKDSRVSVRLRCTGSACNGTVKLQITTTVTVRHGKKRVRKHRTIVIGNAHFSIKAGATRSLEVKLNATGRRDLAKASHHDLKIETLATVKHGNSATRRETIKAATKHKQH